MLFPVSLPCAALEASTLSTLSPPLWVNQGGLRRDPFVPPAWLVDQLVRDSPYLHSHGPPLLSHAWVLDSSNKRLCLTTHQHFWDPSLWWHIPTLPMGRGFPWPVRPTMHHPHCPPEGVDKTQRIITWMTSLRRLQSKHSMVSQKLLNYLKLSSPSAEQSDY